MTRRLRELALWAGAALGLLAVACALAVALGGFSLLVFRSGSMAPEIPTGGLGISRTVSAGDIERGDVVSVVTSEGERVTHRVVTSTVRDGEASLVLQGDANLTPDQEVYVVTETERVVASAPYAGYVLAHILTPPGLVAVLCLAAMMWLLSSGGPEERSGRRGGEPRNPRTRTKRPRRRTPRMQAALSVSAVVTAAGLAVSSGVSGTWATFTEPATMSSGTFGARVLDPPTGVACSTTPDTYVRWTAPAGLAPTGYRVTWVLDGVPGTADVGAGVLQWRPPAPGSWFSSDTYTQVRVAALRGSAWTSAQSTPATSIETSRIIISTSWTCP